MLQTPMRHATRPADRETEAERLLLEAAIAEARNDPRPAIPHAIMRDQILAEIVRLKRKATVLTKTNAPRLN